MAGSSGSSLHIQRGGHFINIQVPNGVKVRRNADLILYQPLPPPADLIPSDHLTARFQPVRKDILPLSGPFHRLPPQLHTYVLYWPPRLPAD